MAALCCCKVGNSNAWPCTMRGMAMQSGFRVMDVNFPLSCKVPLLPSLSIRDVMCGWYSNGCCLSCMVLLVRAKGTFSSGCGVHVLAMFCISRMPSRRHEVTEWSYALPSRVLPLDSNSFPYLMPSTAALSLGGLVSSCSVTATDQISCHQKIPWDWS